MTPSAPMMAASTIRMRQARLIRLRSCNRRTIAARSSGMPSPEREDVTSTSGNAAGMLGKRGGGLGDVLFQLGRLHLVRLGQHHLIAHGGLVQRLQHVLVDILDAVARVDQHIDPRQRGASLQELMDQLGPGRDLGLRRRGVAIAGHVDQPQSCFVGAVEEDQLLGAARRMRGARQRVAAGERIDQARFADIGAAGKRHLHARHRRQRLDRGRGPDELPVAGEEFSPLFDQLRIGFGGHAKVLDSRRHCGSVARSNPVILVQAKTWIASALRSLAMTDHCERRVDHVFSTAFFGANVALRLSNSSTFTPFLRMM